nr:reverse transcriptase domain-containing protein [Tanacetum cinerariifolium]
MVGREVLSSFSVNNIEIKLLEEWNPLEQSRLGMPFGKEILEGGMIRRKCFSCRCPKTAPMENSLASDISSNGRFQFGAIKIGASVSFFFNVWKALIQSSKKMNGVSFSRRHTMYRADPWTIRDRVNQSSIKKFFNLFFNDVVDLRINSSLMLNRWQLVVALQKCVFEIGRMDQILMNLDHPLDQEKRRLPQSRKSLSSNGVSVGEVVDTIRSSEGVGLPLATTNLKNDITNFQQRFDETFSEACDRFKDLLRKCPHHDALTIIKNKSKVRTSQNKPVVSKVNTTTFSSSPYLEFTALTDIVKELVLSNKANQQAFVKAVEETCVTCGGPNPYYECLPLMATLLMLVQPWGPTIKEISNMKIELKNEFKTTMLNQNNELRNMMSNEIKNMMSSFIQMQSLLGYGSLHSNIVANPRGDLKAITTRSSVAYDGPTIPPTPSPLSKEMKRETEAIKDKVQSASSERLESCMALADLGASINLMPLSVWKKLSLPDLTPTRMTLELATRSFAYPAGIAEDIFVQVGKFTFPANFIVVDYDVDPRVPLILGRPFLRTTRALVDVQGEELILRDDYEKLIFHADMLKFKKSNHLSSGSTTPLSDFSPSLTPFETSDSLLEEFTDELALFDPFPPGNEDNNFDFQADIREIKYLNQDPSTESNNETIDPILEKFTDEPDLDYLPPLGDDDDDLFDLKSDNEVSILNFNRFLRLSKVKLPWINPK